MKALFDMVLASDGYTIGTAQLFLILRRDRSKRPWVEVLLIALFFAFVKTQFRIGRSSITE